MATYNGHRSWNAWNVALWIGNDEGLYNLALDCLRRANATKRAAKRPERTSAIAARLMLSELGEGARTPDGAKYNLTCIREALAGLN
jgi:hypothetical protein